MSLRSHGPHRIRESGIGVASVGEKPRKRRKKFLTIAASIDTWRLTLIRRVRAAIVDTDDVSSLRTVVCDWSLSGDADCMGIQDFASFVGLQSVVDRPPNRTQLRIRG